MSLQEQRRPRPLLFNAMTDSEPHFPPLIIGDSHAGYMAKAFGDYAGGFEEINHGHAIPVVREGVTAAECIIINPHKTVFFSQRFEEEGRNLLIDIDPIFHAALQARRDRCPRVLLSLEGNSHNAQFMLQAEIPFDFHDPDSPDIYQPDHQVVPREVVLQHFDFSARLLGVKLGLLRQYLGDVPLYWFAPPPPIPSHEHIAAFPEGFRMAERGITHPWVRLKIYRAYVQTLAAVVQAQAAHAVLAPRSCTDEHGFLLQPYWNQCTHASPGFYSEACHLYFPHGIAAPEEGLT